MKKALINVMVLALSFTLGASLGYAEGFSLEGLLGKTLKSIQNGAKKMEKRKLVEFQDKMKQSAGGGSGGGPGHCSQHRAKKTTKTDQGKSFKKAQPEGKPSRQLPNSGKKSKEKSSQNLPADGGSERGGFGFGCDEQHHYSKKGGNSSGKIKNSESKKQDESNDD